MPPYINILGSATNPTTVTVNSNATDRNLEYFHKMVSVDNTNNGPVWYGITVNSTNVSVTGNVLLPPANQQFYYDTDGNLTNDAVWMYSWDGENRLVQLSNVLSVANGARLKLDFIYDYQGRRLQKVVSTNNGTAWVPVSTNRFIYDGWNMIAELNCTNGLVRSYMWGLDLNGSEQGAGGVGGLLEVSYYGSQTTNCFVGYDGNGNVSELVDANGGAVVARYEYGPFGEIVCEYGLMAKTNPFRFSTKYQDDETDLIYYGYRFLNTSTGSWLSRDPIGERLPAPAEDQEDSEDFEPQRGEFAHRGRGGDSGNLYSFVTGDPIGRIDPLGLITFKGCKPEQEEAMKKAFKENCDKVKSSLFSCCMKAGSSVYQMRKICDQDNLVVKCHQKETFWNGCKDRCGWTHWARGTIDNKPVIHLCPAGLNEDGCPAVGCTVFHEMMHTTNWSNDERSGQKAEVCLGCPPTDLWPDGPPPLP